MDSIGKRTAKSAASDGNTLVGTLRKNYGKGFAAGYPEIAKQSEVLLQLNETSLSQLRRDQETDHLEHKIDQASKRASIRRILALELKGNERSRYRHELVREWRWVSERAGTSGKIAVPSRLIRRPHGNALRINEVGTPRRCCAAQQA
jgi:hypothetical protein